MNNKSTLPQPDPNDGKQRGKQWQAQLRTYAGYAVTLLLTMWFFQQFFVAPRAQQASEIAYSTFKQELAGGQIVDVVIGDSSLTGTMLGSAADTAADAATDPMADTVPFNTVFAAGGDPKLVDELQQAEVQYSFQPPPNPIGGFLLTLLLPLLLLGGVWLMLSRRMSQGAGGIFNVGKSKATEVKPETVVVSYKDVGGADEAIAELQEIIQFLKTPEQFTAFVQAEKQRWGQVIQTLGLKPE